MKESPTSLPLNPTVSLIIFDCDGILVDSEPLSVDIVRAILDESGWDLPREEIIERFLGTSVANVRAQLEEHTGHLMPEGWEKDLQMRHETIFEKQLKAVPHVRGAIRALQSYPRCVASSSSPRRIKHSLELVALWDEFDAASVFSASMVAHGKPAPDLFLFAAAAFDVPPEECVVVEDSRYGVRAANAAGMRALGFGGGLTPPEWLAAEGATVFNDMRELYDLIQTL